MEQRQDLLRGRQSELDTSSYSRSLREAEESVQVGGATLEALQDQQETLDRSEDRLDMTAHVLAQSKRVLRGMTWIGSLQNHFWLGIESQYLI